MEMTSYRYGVLHADNGLTNHYGVFAYDIVAALAKAEKTLRKGDRITSIVEYGAKL